MPGLLHSNTLGQSPFNAAFAGEHAKHTASVPQSIEPPGIMRSAKSDGFEPGGSLAMLAMNRVLKSRGAAGSGSAHCVRMLKGPAFAGAVSAAGRGCRSSCAN